MRCPECGVEVGADERFCGNCGAPLQDVESALPTEEGIPSGEETVLSEPPAASHVEGPPAPGEAEAFSGEETVVPELALPPLEPVPPPPTVLKGGSRNRTGLTIAIVVLVVLVLCCCCILAVVGLNLETISEDLGDLFAMVVLAWTAVA